MRIGTKVLQYASLNSTNDFIKRHFSTLQSRTVVIADTQKKGRGRFNRQWHSGKGGLWFSILVKHTRPDATFLLTFAAAVSVAKAINDLRIPARIKWPNDIWIREKKVCGILTENMIKGSTINTIVGIGINVNNQIHLSTATTMKKELGKEIDKDILLKRILKYYNTYCSDFQKGSYRKILSDWNRYWLSKGKTVKMKTVNGTFKGTAIGISEEGSLILQTRKGKKTIVEGDVRT